VAVACGEWCRVGPEPVARSPGLLTKGAPRLIRHDTRVPAIATVQATGVPAVSTGAVLLLSAGAAMMPR